MASSPGSRPNTPPSPLSLVPQPAQPGGFVRAARAHGGFDVLAQSVVRDTRLSYRALGLLMRLLSNAPGFSMDSNALAAARGREGRDAVRTGLRELRKAGYITTTQSQLPNGHWVTQNTVHDLPADGSEPTAETRFHGTVQHPAALPVPVRSKANLTAVVAPAPAATEDGFSGVGPTEDGFSGVGAAEDGFSGPGPTEDGFSGAKSSRSTHKSKSKSSFAAQQAVLPNSTVPSSPVRPEPAPRSRAIPTTPDTLDLPGIPPPPTAVASSLESGPVAANTPSGRRRGCRIGDWRPDEDDLAWARAQCPAVDVAFEADQFVDYWKSKPGAAACKLDWHLTWHTWVRKAAKTGQQWHHERKSKTKQAMDAVTELAELYEKVSNRTQTPAEYARYMELTHGRGL